MDLCSTCHVPHLISLISIFSFEANFLLRALFPQVQNVFAQLNKSSNALGFFAVSDFLCGRLHYPLSTAPQVLICAVERPTEQISASTSYHVDQLQVNFLPLSILRGIDGGNTHCSFVACIMLRSNRS